MFGVASPDHRFDIVLKQDGARKIRDIRRDGEKIADNAIEVLLGYEQPRPDPLASAPTRSGPRQAEEAKSGSAPSWPKKAGELRAGIGRFTGYAREQYSGARAHTFRLSRVSLYAT